MTERTSHTFEWLRFPLIAAVVLLHSGENGVTGTDLYSTLCLLLSHGLLRIAVPCFFLISGFLFFGGLEEWNTPRWKEKIRRRCRTLLIPYLLWNIIAFVVGYLYGLLRASVNGWALTSVTDALAQVGWINMFWGCTLGCPVDYPLWFLRDLIIFVALTPAIFWVVKKFRLPGLLLLFAAFWLTRSRDFEGLFYFMLGAWMRIESKDPLEIFSKWKWWSYVLTAVLLVAIAFTYREHQLAYGFIKYAFVAAGVCATFCLSATLLDAGIARPTPWLARASFFVYCSHAVLILHDISNFIVLHLLPDTVAMACVGLFLRAALAIGICLGLYWLMERMTPRTLALLTGGRKR